MKKKIMLLISAVLMAVGIGSGWSGAGTVEASSTYISGDFEYTLNDGKATIIGYGGDDTTVVVPDTIDKYKVEGIDLNEYEKIDNTFVIKEIIIPDSVSVIGNGSFIECYNLERVSGGNGVTVIGDYAFAECGELTEVSGFENVTEIGEAAFKECCILEKFDISENVMTIGDEAFYQCHYLKGIELPEGLEVIGNSAFSDCCSLTSITIPSTLKVLGGGAFSSCADIRSAITLPDTLEELGEGAFAGCGGIKELNLGKGITKIPANTFSGVGIDSYDIPAHITAIGDGAFCYTPIKSITIPDTVTEIGYGLFENCPWLTKVKLPSGLTTIPGGTFSECTRLVDVTIPSKVSVIESGAFALCESLEKIVIPNSVKTIGEGAFNGCNKLKNITIPSSVTSIGWLAFQDVPLVHNLSSAKENDWRAKVIHKESASTCSICHYVCKHTSKTTKVTAATASKDGSIASVCNECKKTVSTKPIYKASSVKLSTATYAYNGKTKSPTVTVKDSKGNTISSKYYTVTKPSGRKNVGKYTYKIKFKGNYSGSKSLTLTINPKATKIKTPSKAKKAFTAKWTKVSSQVTGYQIMYSTNSKFKSGNKTVTVNKYKTTSKKISKLKAKKTYYVKVRTYKTVKVNGKSTKLYSAWSGVKKVKTK